VNICHGRAQPSGPKYPVLCHCLHSSAFGLPKGIHLNLDGTQIINILLDRRDKTCKCILCLNTRSTLPPKQHTLHQDHNPSPKTPQFVSTPSVRPSKLYRLLQTHVGHLQPLQKKIAVEKKFVTFRNKSQYHQLAFGLLHRTEHQKQVFPLPFLLLLHLFRHLRVKDLPVHGLLDPLRAQVFLATQSIKKLQSIVENYEFTSSISSSNSSF